MKKNQILVIVIALLFIAGIFFLPKVVVKDDKKIATAESEQHTNATEPTGNVTAQPDLEAMHSKDVSAEDTEKLNSLRNNFQTVSDKQKKVIFADSLASMFIKLNKLDSAASYYEQIAELQPDKGRIVKAADSYYEAFSFSANADKGKAYNVKARELYNKALEKEPADLNVKARLAMTYVTSDNPMQGIVMLREVLEADPNNEVAIYNLGILSIQSGQYDKAAERFEKLISVNPGHLQGRFYLAVSYMEDGKIDKAIEQFKKVKTLDSDPAVQSAVDSYLKDLENK